MPFLLEIKWKAFKLESFKLKVKIPTLFSNKDF